MDNRPQRNLPQPLNVPYYTGRNMIDALSYMEEIMQVFRVKKNFPRQQQSQQPNREPQGNGPHAQQEQIQEPPQTDRNQIRERIQQTYHNNQISQRARRAQTVSDIALQGARSHALANIGLAVNPSVQQESSQQPAQQNQEPIQQIKEPIQENKESEQVSIQPKAQTQVNLQPSLISNSNSLFGNLVQRSSSNQDNQTQGTPIVANQPQVTLPLFASQNQAASTVSNQSQNLSIFGNSSQTSSMFGNQNQAGTSIFQKPNQNVQITQGGLFGTGLSTIRQEKSESSKTEVQPKSDIHSFPQKTGGFFGSSNTVSQPSKLIPQGGLFGTNVPRNPNSISNKFNTQQKSQPAQPLKPTLFHGSLGNQIPTISEQAPEKEKEVKKDQQKNQPEKVPEEKPAQQINLFGSQRETTPQNHVQNSPQHHAPNISQDNSSATIFTLRPAQNNTTTAQPVLPPKETTEPPKTRNIFANNQPFIKQKEPQQKSKVNMFGTIQTPVPQNQPQEQRLTTNIFGLKLSTTQNQPANIFVSKPETTLPTPSLINPFGNISNQPNMFALGNTSNNMFLGQNIFGATRPQGASLFGAPSGASLFQNEKSEKKQKDADGSDNDGEDDGENDGSNLQQVQQEQNQGQIKYEGYNLTEDIYKLQAPVPLFKIVSTSVRHQKITLSLVKFPDNETIYIVVRMANKNPIFFGILTKYSNIKSLSDNIGKNFSVAVEKLIQIDLVNDNKKSLDSWKIQFNDSPNARGFVAKCEEIINNLQNPPQNLNYEKSKKQ